MSCSLCFQASCMSGLQRCLCCRFCVHRPLPVVLYRCCNITLCAIHTIGTLLPGLLSNVIWPTTVPTFFKAHWLWTTMQDGAVDKSRIQACCVLRAGLAEQAAGKLPPLVSLSAGPHPSDQQHPSDTPSWEQHITQGPLQVWHQATTAVMSSLPRSFFPSKAPQQRAPAETAAGDDEPGAAGLHAWHRFHSMSVNNLSQGVGRGVASCWQSCQRAAEGMPQLVPKKGLEEGNEQVRLERLTVDVGRALYPAGEPCTQQE